MGTARTRRDRRDLSKYETLFEDPEYERLRAFSGARHEERVTAATFAGGASLETLGGLAAIILGVLGFSTAPFAMASVGTICIGVALFAQGAAVMTRWRDALHRLQGAGFDRQELIGGLSTEFFAGIVGIVLGVLAIVDVKPLIMLPVASIVFGGALLLGGAAQPELAAIAGPASRTSVQEAVEASGGIMVLIGIASAVLGILSLLEVGPVLTLALVALLCVGATLFFAGGALAARFMRRFA